VVWVRGEHDISTRDRVTVRLAKAAGRDAADIVVDLSGVTFMDASTIGALVASRNDLRVHSRSLTFRHPSQTAQRLLDLCGLTSFDRRPGADTAADRVRTGHLGQRPRTQPQPGCPAAGPPGATCSGAGDRHGGASRLAGEVDPAATSASMNDQERRQAILGRLLDHTDRFTTARLCQVCADVTGVTGAGIILITGDVAHGSACTTDAVSALVEQLQYDLGEGPCVDAYHQDHPVLEPDLADPDTPRSTAFTGPAVDAGARAVFGFPLQVGVARLGALNLYNDRPLTDVARDIVARRLRFDIESGENDQTPRPRDGDLR
jgi:anti-anti-sigma factor